MSNSFVIFGDEVGLEILRITSSSKITNVKAIVISKGREAAKDIARRWGCKILIQPSYLDIMEYKTFIKEIKELKPDFGFCFSYDRILKADLLSIFPKGVYNVHGGLLPQLRGANILNWVLVNGEEHTGITIHKMVDRVDAGPILIQKRIDIKKDDTALTLREKLICLAIELIPIALDSLQSGNYELHYQDESLARYYIRRTLEDGYLEWNWSTERIYNLIRALVKPWPGAWYIEDNKKIIIDYFISFSDLEKLQKEKFANGSK